MTAPNAMRIAKRPRGCNLSRILIFSTKDFNHRGHRGTQSNRYLFSFRPPALGLQNENACHEIKNTKSSATSVSSVVIFFSGLSEFRGRRWPRRPPSDRRRDECRNRTDKGRGWVCGNGPSPAADAW